ncbi:MAG: hypothetical protein ACT4UQ_01375 [Gammaproteobacteria bacterium]
MRGIVTFTTDFWQRDPWVAMTEGQVLRRAPRSSRPAPAFRLAG